MYSFVSISFYLMSQIVALISQNQYFLKINLRNLFLVDFKMDFKCSSSNRSTLYCQSPCSFGSSLIDENDEINSKEDDMSLCMSNYAKLMLKMMFMMRSHAMLTDVVLEVKQELFPAHKLVLSAGSPYFKAMFTGGLKEAEMSRVQLQGVCSKKLFKKLYV